VHAHAEMLLDRPGQARWPQRGVRGECLPGPGDDLGRELVRVPWPGPGRDQAGQPGGLQRGGGLSYRDVEELLAERGVTVDHVTVYRWVQRFTPEFIEAARPCRHAPGDRWFVDETYLKVAGKWT
jgi:hypothetical protein